MEMLLQLPTEQQQDIRLKFRTARSSKRTPVFQDWLVEHLEALAPIND